MSDDRNGVEVEIIQSGYAERVTDAFKVFAENLSVGQAEKACQERFLRAVVLAKKARDLALLAISGGGVVEPEETREELAAKNAENAKIAGEGLSEDDQAMIRRMLEGSTGVQTPPVHRR